MAFTIVAIEEPFTNYEGLPLIMRSFSFDSIEDQLHYYIFGAHF